MVIFKNPVFGFSVKFINIHLEIKDLSMQNIENISDQSLELLLSRYSLALKVVKDNAAIPGSHWGESEAGLIGNTLYVRADTPVHSALHEACHFICMDSERRLNLHTDAGGDYDEENAVCFLQILLSEKITGNSAKQLMKEMDAWGYSFRLGSASDWFYRDAEDARQWLLDSKLITPDNEPTWKLKD